MKKLFAVLCSLACSSALSFAAENQRPAGFKNISVEEAAKLLKDDQSIVVLDVRTGDEFKAGHIPGAKNVDILEDDFKAKLGALDKSKTYVVHCQAGGRSSRAEKTMQELKFQSVLHLKEGFGAWEAKGKPVEK